MCEHWLTLAFLHWANVSGNVGGRQINVGPNVFGTCEHCPNIEYQTGNVGPDVHLA